MRKILCFLLTVLVSTQAEAQNDTIAVINPVDSLAEAHNDTVSGSVQDLHFVYIDHEPTTPATVLSKRIKDLRKGALEHGDALIVYMANELSPMISFTNLREYALALEKQRDSEDAFYDIIDALQTAAYHEVNSTVDVDSIKHLIGPEGMFPAFSDDDGGTLLYRRVIIDFYVGRRFWDLRYNQEIIASLFTSLGIDQLLNKYRREQFSFNVLKPQGEQLRYEPGKAFGLLDTQGINSKLSIMEY